MCDNRVSQTKDGKEKKKARDLEEKHEQKYEKIYCRLLFNYCTKVHDYYYDHYYIVC